MIAAVLFDFGETLVERIVDDVSPLSDLVVVAFPDAAPTLERLVPEGYRLGVVSNTTQSSEWHLRAALRATGLEPFFDVVVTSFDVGRDKPEPDIFRRALESLRCHPTEAVMVGNDVVADIAGAAALGMTTVLVARGADVVPEQAGVEPSFVVRSLAEIPALLAGGDGGR